MVLYGVVTSRSPFERSLKKSQSLNKQMPDILLIELGSLPIESMSKQRVTEYMLKVQKILSLWLPRITNNITLSEWCLFAMSMYRGMGNMWKLTLHILNYTCCTITKPYFSLNKESAYMLSISKATHTSREEECINKGFRT